MNSHILIISTPPLPPPPPFPLAGALPHFSSRCSGAEVEEGRGDECAIADSEVRSPFAVIFIHVNQLCVGGRRLHLRTPHPHPPLPTHHLQNEKKKQKNTTNTGLVRLQSAEKEGLGNVCIRLCIVSGWVVVEG